MLFILIMSLLDSISIIFITGYILSCLDSQKLMTPKQYMESLYDVVLYEPDWTITVAFLTLMGSVCLGVLKSAYEFAYKNIIALGGTTKLPSNLNWTAGILLGLVIIILAASSISQSKQSSKDKHNKTKYSKAKHNKVKITALEPVNDTEPMSEEEWEALMRYYRKIIEQPIKLELTPNPYKHGNSKVQSI